MSMCILMVGIFKIGEDVAGFKFLSVDDNNNTQVKDVAYNVALDTVLKNPNSVKNLKVENNKLKGVNGAIDRYGVVGKTHALVIIKENTDKNGKLINYLCSDSLGKTKVLSEKEAIAFGERFKVANGKIVTMPDGSKHISAIEGSYSEVKINTPNTNATNNNANNGLYEKALDLINKLNNFKEFKNSFEYKVASTVTKTKRCSDNQFNCLSKAYKRLSEKHNKEQSPVTPINTINPVKHITEVSKPGTSPKAEETPKAEEPVKVKPLSYIAPAMESSDILKFSILKNNTAQVCGFSSNDIPAERYKHIRIPDSVSLNGKKYIVSAIRVNAFNGTDIEAITTGENMTDIGQGAFICCNKLISVDFSLSKHTFIPMQMCKDCIRLERVLVGNNVQRIHESAFENCKRLVGIELSSNVDTIARLAFEKCVRLEYCKQYAKTIGEGAFRGCLKLEKFDFTNVQTIGSAAFRLTGLKEVTLAPCTRTIGRKAFADCIALRNVNIIEGTEEIGQGCFIKLEKSAYLKELGQRELDEYTSIECINTPKSIKTIEDNAFKNVDLVKVWTGSVAESHCIGFNIPHINVDATNTDNSTKVRVKSEMIGSNPIETLYTLLSTECENGSNPEFVLNTSKLVDIPFNDASLTFFSLNRTTDIVEPHIKFKAIANYIQSIAPLLKEPLSNSILRLQDTFYVNSNIIYDDGCNRVVRASYQIMDTLEQGDFIMIIMNNSLRYIAEINAYTNIEVDNNFECNDAVPVNKFIHAGDTIGKQATMDGHACILYGDAGEMKANVGEMMFNRLMKHGIKIQISKRDFLLYEPVDNVLLSMHDDREYDKPNEIKKGIKDCINVLEVIKVENIKDYIGSKKKSNASSKKFFDDLAKLSESAVKRRVALIGEIAEEKEAQLFQISKQFRAIIDSNQIESDKITVELLTPQLFNEISNSYWMIEKDVAWLKSTGTKSLNKTIDYNIGNYKLVEYKSNQIVKFSNPYMNGQKGAYVFTLMSGSQTVGVYASRYSMQQIIRKLYDLTDIPNNVEPVELFTDPYNFDKVNPKLFYTFYDVLYSKGGWMFSSYLNMSYSNNSGASFHISMYKPNGVFYLTMEAVTAVTRYTSKGEKEKEIRANRVMPIIPIGNMDRALMVATTTNTNAKDSKLLKELMELALVDYADSNSYLQRRGYNRQESKVFENYTKARDLIVQGVADVKQYKQLIDDRAVYMLGTIPKGAIQREKSYEQVVDDKDETIYIDDSELEIDDSDLVIDESELLIDEPEIEEDDLIIEGDLDEYIDDLGEEDEDEEELEQITLEDFAEAAKAQGITDMRTVQAMYINFKNANNI